MTDERNHDWTCHWMAAFSAGLLDEESSERLEKHALDCAECRGELASLRSPEAGHGRHLPDGLVSRWGQEKFALRGLQRELVRRHLDECAECRQILQQLGHEPELEASQDVEAVATGVGKTGDTRVWMVEPGPQRRRWMNWVLGGWAAAATAVAAVLLIVPNTQPQVGRNSPSGLAPTSTGTPPLPIPPSASGPQFALDVLRNPTHLQVMRGPGEQPVITVTRSTRMIRVTAEAPDVPESALVRVVLAAPDGRKVLDEIRSVRDFYGQGRLLISSATGFRPGKYELRIAGQSELSGRVAVYPFTIQETFENP